PPQTGCHPAGALIQDRPPYEFRVVRRMGPRVYDTVDETLARMRDARARLPREAEARRFFHGTYLRTTEAVLREVERGGFMDGEWVRDWDLAFATFYLDAVDADLRGQPVSRPW